MIRRTLLILLYFFYGIILIGVLLVMLFPKDSFRTWLAERMERELPGFQLRIEEVRYVHPLKIMLEGLVLENPIERLNLSIDSLVAGIERQWPIRNMQVSAELYGGEMKADVNLNRRENFVGFSNLSISSIRLEDVDVLQKKLDRQIRGIGSMSGYAKISGTKGLGVSFDGIVEIEQFFTRLRRPVLTLSEIDLASATSGVRLSPGTISLMDGRFEGELLSGEFSGTITLQEPLQQSRLDIAGGMIPDSRMLEGDPALTENIASLYREYRQETIPCRVEGTIQEPQFRFGRK